MKSLKYRYHFQTLENEFVARWDNAPHHPDVESHPDHLHLAQGSVKSSQGMDLECVLAAVLPFLTQD